MPTKLINMNNIHLKLIFIGILLIPIFSLAQLQWTNEGKGYYSYTKDGVQIIDLASAKTSTFLPASALTPKGSQTPLSVASFAISADGTKILLFTNTKRVWREETRGDYWIYNKTTASLQQIGKGFPAGQLMFAKFSPDGSKVAYVTKHTHNIYIEDIATQQISPVTTDGTARLINGTFDWVYEEEFGCKDGFRWSPDGQTIAYWKLDATSTRNFLMINNTDSIYAFTIPVEYPKVGQDPSACTIWTYHLASKKTSPVHIDGSPIQHYIPRMEWTIDSKNIILQQLNRKQNISKIILADIAQNTSKTIYTETDEAWIDIKSRWNNNDPSGWDWVDNGRAFIWVSEKDGYRKLYKIDMSGKETLLLKDNMDLISFELLDNVNKCIYFTASPKHATQKYLYVVSLNGGSAKRITPDSFAGTASYTISPNGKLALFNFSSHAEMLQNEVISLPQHQTIQAAQNQVKKQQDLTEFFTVKTADGVTLDGWMVKPTNFDPAKKYPVLFYVYGEPAGQTVTDTHLAGYNNLYNGNIAADGYIYIMEDLGEQYVGYTDNDPKNTSLFGLKSLRLGKELEIGNVLTVEPGVYIIPELFERWQAEKQNKDFINYDFLSKHLDFGGIRIEDNYSITADGYERIGSYLEREVEELYSLRSDAY